MTDAQTEIARENARNEVASMFPAADTLSYRCRALVEMVDGHAATTLILAQIQIVIEGAFAAIRLEIATEAATTAELIKEAQDAVATTAVVKDGTGNVPIGTDASPVARTEADGRIDEEGVSEFARAVADVGVLGALAACNLAAAADSPDASPLSSLSASEYGGMVGAVDLYLLGNHKGSIRSLANAAQVSEAQMRAYVARADHLCLDHRDFVRRVSG